MQTVELKRGDTFTTTCTYLDSDGDPADYVGLGITIESQVRDSKGVLIGDLTVTPGGGTGEFLLESDSTQNWPVGKLFWDIQFTQGSHVFSTVTAALNVSSDVTQ